MHKIIEWPAFSTKSLDLQREAETLSCPIDHSNPGAKHKREQLQLCWDIQAVMVYLGVSVDLVAFIEWWVWDRFRLTAYLRFMSSASYLQEGLTV